jgi:acyl carrier protein
MASVTELRQLIEKVSGRPTSSADDENLFENGILDSYNITSLALELEDWLEITFDFEDIGEANFRNIDSILKMLSEKYGARLSVD